jgi:hypothetical protein
VSSEAFGGKGKQSFLDVAAKYSRSNVKSAIRKAASDHH